MMNDELLDVDSMTYSSFIISNSALKKSSSLKNQL